MKDKKIAYNKATDEITLIPNKDINEDIWHDKLSNLFNSPDLLVNPNQENSLIKDLKKEKLISIEVLKFFDIEKCD